MKSALADLAQEAIKEWDIRCGEHQSVPSK